MFFDGLNDIGIPFALSCVGQVVELDLDPVAVVLLQIVADDLRGLLRRPMRSSAAGEATLLQAVRKNGNEHRRFDGLLHLSYSFAK